MTVRDLVMFRADFPDDSKWDERDNLLVPGGKAIAAALREGLQLRGVTCAPVEQHSFYGWSFDATLEGLVVFLVLQGGDEWDLSLYERWRWLHRLCSRKSASRFNMFQDRVHDVFKSDARFSRVRWHNREEYARSRGKEAGTASPREHWHPGQATN